MNRITMVHTSWSWLNTALSWLNTDSYWLNAESDEHGLYGSSRLNTTSSWLKTRLSWLNAESYHDGAHILLIFVEHNLVLVERDFGRLG